jgi:hypothetical protein
MLLYDDLRPSRGKRPAGYLPLFDDATLRDEAVSEDAVTPQERESILRQAGELAGGTIGRLGDALSAPGDYIRGVLAGKPGERVGGRDLLKSYGIVPQEDNWGSFALGLAADTITDPLSFISGPAASLTKAGRAAKSLNLLDNAASAATKKAISSGAAAAGDLPTVAKRTMAELKGAGRKQLSAFDPAVTGRPLYGTRTARRAVTLDDLIRHADDPKQAEEAARRLLGDGLDKVRNEKLADTFGLGLPLGDAKITGDVFGKGFGDNYADALDTLGQAVRWSAPGRYAASFFDNRVGGAVDAEDQLTRVADFGARRKARSVAANADVYNRAKLYETTPDAFTEEGNRVMGRLLETPQAAWSAEDKAWLAARPGAENYIAGWKNLREEAVARSRMAGLTDAEIVDKYGAEYLPRKAEAALDMASKRDRKLGDALSAFTGDMLRRTDAFQLPGGRNTIMELSQDAYVAGAKRAAGSDEEAAQYIIDKLTPMIPPGQPPISRAQALRVARTLNALPDDVVKKAPLFGQHPVESIGSYLTGRAESEATMKTMYDSLATFAEQGAYSDKSRHISMKEALRRIGARTYDEGATGGERHIRERLARLWGAKADNISLAEVSIPEEAVARLARARDAYSTGEASGKLLNWLDHYTQAWRGSILTWPSRAVRDLYSGAVSNWLEGAFDPASISAARSLMSDGADGKQFREWLSRQTRYAGDDGVARFYGELAGTGLVQGPTGFEIGASTIGQRALDPLVGAQPVNVGAIVSELMPQQGRTWAQFGRDFTTWRSKLKPLVETQNPIMRAGEKMNSLTDGINRISGYMALVGQGVEPEAAAAAMKRVHVDMSSLSDFERLYLKNLFPWYTYQSRIFREVLRQLVERPGGRFGQLVQATQNAQEANDDQYMSSSLRSRLAIPVPEMLGGRPAPGTQRYWVPGGVLPGFDQLNMLAVGDTLSGTVKGTARQLGMQLHPLYRVGLETVFDKDLYTNRPAGESTSSPEAILRNVTGDRSVELPTVLEKAIENLPFAQRPLYMMRSLTDLRGDAPLSSRAAKTAINTFTGTHVKDESAEEAAADAVREIEESIDPYTREFKQVYIPQDMQPNVPDWALRRLAVTRALSRERREARKPKGAQRKRRAKRKSDTQIPSLFD